MKQCFKVDATFDLNMSLGPFFICPFLDTITYHCDEISCFYVLRWIAINIKVAMYSVTHGSSLANITYQIT